MRAATSSAGPSYSTRVVKCSHAMQRGTLRRAPEGASVKLVGASFKPVVGSAVSAVVFSPATGAVTPLKALTTRLVETYHTVNPSRQKQQVLRRVLTQPSKPAANGCVTEPTHPISMLHIPALSFSRRGILQRL